MLYYYILTFIKLHLISTTSATTTINVFLEEKTLFIKSELTYRALCAPGVILNLIS